MKTSDLTVFRFGTVLILDSVPVSILGLEGQRSGSQEIKINYAEVLY